MMNYEVTQNQDVLDEAVVADALTEIEQYVQAENEQDWADKYTDAGTYIDALYDTFAPEVGEQARMIGRIVGATGLALAEVRYGRDEYSPKLYGGSYEDRVLATYHHGGHPRTFIKNMFAYAQKVNEYNPDTYSEHELARFPGVGAFHDLIMGNGRGHDERQSARFAGEFMAQIGFSLAPDEETEAGVLATTWNAERCMQAVDDNKPHVEMQRAAAVADLLSIFDQSGPYQGICVVVEDMCKRMNDRLFVSEADMAGFSLVGASIEDCMRFIDTNDRVRAIFADALAGQAGFFANFKPVDARLDEMFPGRTANVQFMEELNGHYAQGNLSALDVLHACRDFMNQ